MFRTDLLFLYGKIFMTIIKSWIVSGFLIINVPLLLSEPLTIHVSRLTIFMSFVE